MNQSAPDFLTIQVNKMLSRLSLNIIIYFKIVLDKKLVIDLNQTNNRVYFHFVYCSFLLRSYHGESLYERTFVAFLVKLQLQQEIL
jgi:hypothetical protein